MQPLLRLRTLHLIMQEQAKPEQQLEFGVCAVTVIAWILSRLQTLRKPDLLLLQVTTYHWSRANNKTIHCVRMCVWTEMQLANKLTPLHVIPSVWGRVDPHVFVCVELSGDHLDGYRVSVKTTTGHRRSRSRSTSMESREKEKMDSVMRLAVSRTRSLFDDLGCYAVDAKSIGNVGRYLNVSSG